jgi:HemY protein
MLWSLIKILIFVTLVAAASVGAIYLLESEGGIQLTVAGTEYTLGPLQSVIALVLLVLALWVILKLFGLVVAILRFVNGDETAISRYFQRNRERRGFEALADGMMAVASGEGSVAMAKASKAERYLQRPELTNLLAAQAAELSGDKRKAQDVYKQLLKDDRTRFVGVRGIMKQKLIEGDTETALKLAEKAFALKPKHVETQDTLLQLQAGAKDWSGARKTLGAKLKHGALPRDVHRRRDAVLALSEVEEIVSDQMTIEAREASIEANRLSPDLVPAAVMAARAYIEQSKPRYATRVLKKAWEGQPHPSLATAFAEINSDETPDERLKRFRPLLKINADHPEAKMLLAELNIAAQDFPSARKALGDLIEADPTARALTLMAAIERGEGADDIIVRGWLTRALTAPRDPQWICDVCGESHGDWQAVCNNCNAFDSIGWKRPSEAEISLPGGADMLPLIVGSVETSDALEKDGDTDLLAVEDDQDDPVLLDAEVIDPPAPDTDTLKK